MRFCISIIGKDRWGIIASVTKVLYELHGNLEDASMTILSGEFAMILLVSFKSGQIRNLLEKKLKLLEKKLKLTIMVKQIEKHAQKTSRKQNQFLPHLISIFGKDRAGIVCQMSRLLARHRLNITDLNSKLIHGEKNIYGLLIETDIPKRFPIAKLERELNRAAKSLCVDLSIKPVEPLTL